MCSLKISIEVAFATRRGSKTIDKFDPAVFKELQKYYLKMMKLHGKYYLKK